MKNWIVSVHTCGGSMGEAVPALLTIGPFEKDVAKGVEEKFHKRLESHKPTLGYANENLWAIAEPVDNATTDGTVDEIVDALWKHESLEDYLDEEALA